MSHEQRNAEFIDKVLIAAKTAFFTPDNPNCLFYRLQVLQKIHKQYGISLDDENEYFHPMDRLVPQPSIFPGQSPTQTIAGGFALPKFEPTKWKALCEERVHVKDPIYLGSENNGTVFQWRSDITLAKLYQHGGDARTWGSPPRYVRLSGYQVRWHADVSADGAIRNADLDQILHSFTKAEPGSLALRQQYSLPTDFDLSRQALEATLASATQSHSTSETG